MSKNLTAREKFEVFKRIYEGNEQGRCSIITGCKNEGISRATYFRWKKKYDDQNGAGLVNKSKKPLTSPNQTPGDIRERIYKLAQSGNYRFASNIRDVLVKEGKNISLNTIIKILTQKGCYYPMMVQIGDEKPYITRINCP